MMERSYSEARPEGFGTTPGSRSSRRKHMKSDANIRGSNSSLQINLTQAVQQQQQLHQQLLQQPQHHNLQHHPPLQHHNAQLNLLKDLTTVITALPVTMDDATNAGTIDSDPLNTAGGQFPLSNRINVKRRSHKPQQQQQLVVQPTTGKIISAIMLWMKNINKMRTIQLTKAFCTWKFRSMASPPATLPAATLAATSTDTMEDAAGAGIIAATASPDQQQQQQQQSKVAFLNLFTENEKLREQLADHQKAALATDRQLQGLRVTSLKTVMQTFLTKVTVTSKLRYYYDVWMNHTKLTNYHLAYASQARELAVGLQQVESEHDYVKKTQQENASLRVTLLVMNYFYHWKHASYKQALLVERRKYEAQRVIIYKELKRLRETVTFANQQEEIVFQTALQQGRHIQQDVHLLRDKLHRLVHQQGSNSSNGSITGKKALRGRIGSADDNDKTSTEVTVATAGTGASSKMVGALAAMTAATVSQQQGPATSSPATKAAAAAAAANTTTMSSNQSTPNSSITGGGGNGAAAIGSAKNSPIVPYHGNNSNHSTPPGQQHGSNNGKQQLHNSNSNNNGHNGGSGNNGQQRRISISINKKV